MNWHSGFVSYISKSWKSTKSKMLKLENFQNEEMFGGHKHKVNYSNFWFSLFPWRRTTFLNNYLEQFEMSQHDVLIWYLANPIKMNSLHTYGHFCFLLIIFFIKDESFTKICIRVLLGCSCKAQERRSNQILGFVNLL